jgi:hypothetical protein
MECNEVNYVITRTVMMALVKDKQLCSLRTAMVEQLCSWHYLPVEIFLQLSNFTLPNKTHISQ